MNFKFELKCLFKRSIALNFLGLDASFLILKLKQIPCTRHFLVQGKLPSRLPQKT